MSCIKCGGEMHGDGYTSVEHCEYAEESGYEFEAPDAGPFYCSFNENTGENNEQSTTL